MEGDKGRSGGWWGLVAAVLLLPVLYVLSMGPAKMAVIRADRGVRAYVRVYAPVCWLHDNTPLRKPLEWYVGAWN